MKQSITLEQWDELSDEEKAFIAIKVQKLNSIEAVESFYNKDRAADRYARSLAEQLYKW